MDYRDKRAVVTGGAGFIGIDLALELVRLGAHVTVVDLPSANYASIPSAIRIVRADILDQHALDKDLADADVVFHLAAKTDLSGKTLEAYAANYDGTRNIIEALRANKGLQRLVVYSTQLVVGIFDETRFIGASEPYRTQTLYGKSKILAEKATIEYCGQYGIPYTIIRPTSVYGPHGNEPYRDLILTIQKHRYFHIGKANNLISMAYVKNVVDQTLFLATAERADGRIFFSNDFHPYTMREFSDAIAEHFVFSLSTVPDLVAYPAAYLMGVLKWLGFSMPLYPFRLKNIKANYCYDISDSIQLGYFPKYGLKDGIKETLDWYLQNDKAFQPRS